MYPVLFHLGRFSFHTYGMVAALAFLAAGYVVYRLLKLRNLPGQLAYEVVFVAALGGLGGARLYWLVQHWGLVSRDLMHYALSGAGFTWYGGLAGGFVAVAAWSLYRRIPLGVTANVMAPAVALGYAVGRVACQLAGDGNYGRPSSLPWAMAYPHGMVPTTVRVQPTPVYETLIMLLVFWFLYLLARKAQPGWYVFAWFLVLSGLERLGIEFLRLNPPWLLGLTAPQWIAIAGIGAGAVLIVALRQRSVASATLGGDSQREYAGGEVAS
jgi:phosphatidylglycerol:prolipoprotein diacylglycerol transferase